MKNEPDDTEPYVLPTHDAGRMLITDWRVLSDMLDDEDVERALRTCSSEAVPFLPASRNHDAHRRDGSGIACRWCSEDQCGADRSG